MIIPKNFYFLNKKLFSEYIKSYLSILITFANLSLE